MEFTAEDLQQIQGMGLTPEIVQNQINNFRQGFPRTELYAAATIKNGGIQHLDDVAIDKYVKLYDKLSSKKEILKFVPASGAASRMFKELYAFSSTYFGVAQNFEKEFPIVKDFLEHIHSFAFYSDLKESMKQANLNLEDYMQSGEYTTVINFLLKEQYLGYGVLPKALLKFHRYKGSCRTPLEEHIVEGAEYAQTQNGEVHIHFTVSPEHRKLFVKKISQIRKHYEKEYNIKLRISLSEQRHYTDIIAVDEQNQPIREEDGRLMFRPGGHGALIENLNECKADIIFVKNIDNVVPDWMKHTTIVYKKALGGMLLDLQKKNFEFLDKLHSRPIDPKIVEKASLFAEKQLHIELPEGFESMTLTQKKNSLVKLLNRPMRICGMVKNQGEPGGGPFFTINTHGIKSLQIVETAQINRKDPQQDGIFNGATHFNPVDLVCATKNYRGQRFNLRKYIDPATGFISKKSKGAQVVKSQELPGLWNGAMANWITLFVEVPLATFNPVKTVNDLLRKEHRESQ